MKPEEHYCFFHWTYDNGLTYHVCDLLPGHTEDHHCWVTDCEETWPVNPSQPTGKKSEDDV